MIEKNQDASLKDIIAKIEAHMNVSSSLKTLKFNETFLIFNAKSLTNLKRKTFRIGNQKVAISSQCKSNGHDDAHPCAKCIFRDAICHKYSIIGHIAKVCRSSAEQSKQSKDHASIK